MAIPSYMTIIDRLFTELDTLLNNYIFHAYSSLAQYLKVPIGLAIILYIVMLGWSITQGWVQLSMGNLMKSAVKLTLIYLTALHWAWFSHYVVDLINKGSGQIGDILVNATPVSFPHFSGTGINGALQSVLIEFTKIGSWTWQRGSWHVMAPYFNAILIWGFGYALILVAVFELVLAKIMLAVLFATAPLFIAFTLFKPTHSFFDRWLGACVGFGLLMIFVSSMLGLSLTIAQWAIAGTIAEKAVHVTFVGFVPIMVVGFIGVGIILKAAQLAQGIGGTITTTSGSSLLAGTIGGAIGSTLSTLKKPLTAVGATRQLAEAKLGGAKRGDSSTMKAIRDSLMRSEGRI